MIKDRKFFKLYTGTNFVLDIWLLNTKSWCNPFSNPLSMEKVTYYLKITLKEVYATLCVEIFHWNFYDLITRWVIQIIIFRRIIN